MVPVALVDARPDQPRRALRPPGLNELARSIAEVGVLQPIRVRRRGERYEVVAGQRRVSAARLAGLTEIPALVTECDDDTAFIEALIENVQREDLSLADRANAIRRVRTALGATSWEAVGRALGISRAHLHRLLAITRLPAAMRDDSRMADLNERHVRALMRLQRDAAMQRALWERIHAESLSGDEALEASTAALAQAADGHVPAVAATRRVTRDLLQSLAQLDAASSAELRPDLVALRAQIERLMSPPT